MGAALCLSSAAGAVTIEKGPYLQSFDTTAVTVCWVSDSDAPSIVDYGPSERLGETIEVEIGRRRLWNAGGPSELKAFHQVRIEGLAPDTRYHYRVRNGDAVSEIRPFRTAPRPGSSFSFVAYGDTRPTDNHRDVVDRVLRLDPEPRFILHTGDMVPNGQRGPDWQGYFDWEGVLIDHIPIYPVLGNHEKNADAYFQLFALPGNERWYSFDVGDAHIITLDSNWGQRGSDAQRAWLIQDLRANYDKPYIFVQFHHPPFTCANQFHRRISYLDIVRDWAPLFEAAEITAVFNGHDHDYQHNRVNGVNYVVAGGGGASIYDVRPREFTVHAAPVYHVVQVDIGPGEATFTAIKADDGAVIERFTAPRRDTTPMEYEAN